MTDYLHGVRTIELVSGSRPIRRTRSSVIGLIGTAPLADPVDWPLNTPILVSSSSATRLATLGASGTLRAAFDDIHDHIAAAVVVVRVTEGGSLPLTYANIAGDSVSLTGVWSFARAKALLGFKPRLLVAPGFTGARPSDGVTTIAVTTAGSGYVATSPPAVTISGGGGSGARAVAVITAGAVSAVTVINPGAGYTTAPTVTIAPPTSGVTALATASRGTVRNPVAAELQAVATRLRAMAIVDMTDTTMQAALTYRADWGSDRMIGIDPGVLVFDTALAVDVPRPASARFAGLQAYIDNERGFWWAASNNEIQGITGTTRPIPFDNDPAAEYDLLNERGITTIVRNDGFRFFGVRSFGNDPTTVFYTVRRTIDIIRDEIEDSMIWAVDKTPSPALIDDIRFAVEDYLRLLKREGAIAGGRCWFDPEQNPVSNLQQGIWTLDFDVEPIAPIEQLRFRISRNPAYYTDLVDEIVRLAA